MHLFRRSANPFRSLLETPEAAAGTAQERKEESQEAAPTIHRAREHLCRRHGAADGARVGAPDGGGEGRLGRHRNLLLGNHRRALDDAEQAVRLSPSNLKVRTLAHSRLLTPVLLQFVGFGEEAAV